MKNVLVTGSNGFIASNLISLFEYNDKRNFNLFKTNRSNLNLYNINEIKSFLEQNKIDVILHTAIKGGNRCTKDTSECFYNNILIFENILSSILPETKFINFGSGAEISSNNTLINIPPVSYYGLSKYIISKRLCDSDINGTNLRIFGCFYYNELETRMIKSNIIKYLKNEPMIIHQDKFMDFIYLEDLYRFVKYIINYNNIKTIDACYKIKYKLSDIVNIINNLENKKVDIIIMNKNLGTDYISDSKLIIPDISLKGLIKGIEECYTKIKQQF